MNHEELIKLSDVSMKWEGRVTLENINLTVRKGDFLAITGPNGGGKTTLLRLLLKLLKPTHGSVEYYFNNSRNGRPAIGYLPQKNLVDSRFPITLRELVESGLINQKVSLSEKKKKVEESLALIGLSDHSEKSIGQLSGGQLQRGLFGRAIISGPELLVLDEPLSYLDKHFEKKMYEIIDSISLNTTIVLVSHEMSTISGMATRHIIIDKTLEECAAEHHNVHYDCDCILPS